MTEYLVGTSIVGFYLVLVSLRAGDTPTRPHSL